MRIVTCHRLTSSGADLHLRLRAGRSPEPTSCDHNAPQGPLSFPGVMQLMHLRRTSVLIARSQQAGITESQCTACTNCITSSK